MKIRKRVILLGLVLGIIISQFIMHENNKAFAASWETISQDEKSFIDTGSVDKVTGNFIGRYGHKIYSAWIKILNKGTEEDKELNKYFGKTYWYKKARVFIDCDRKEIAIKSATYFDLKESAITNGMSDVQDYNLDWDSIIPETTGEDIYTVACLSNQNIDSSTVYTNPYLYQK